MCVCVVVVFVVDVVVGVVVVVVVVVVCVCMARPSDTSFADGHTASNAPDLFRPPKLSGAGPS